MIYPCRAQRQAEAFNKHLHGRDKYAQSAEAELGAGNDQF